MNTQKGFINLIGTVIVGAVILFGSMYTYLKTHPITSQSAQTFGAFSPTGGQTYRLQSSISSTQTTITLTSFKEPISGIKYTMSYLNSSIEYGTLDPQNNTSKEFVSFTGITQNSDGTATLTGVTRGLSFSYPYTASTTLQSAHSGQSIFILSNPPQLYNQYPAKANDEAITGLWNFNSYLPTSSITATSSNQFVTKVYVDSGVLAGAATSTESTTGISRLATRLQQASSTPSTSNTPLVLQAQYATSSFNGSNTTGLNTVITRNNNTIDPNAIATSSSDVYNFGGVMSFNASTTMTATTTIAGSNVNSRAFIINNVAYAYPSAQGASSTALINNGSGTLTWGTPGLLYQDGSTYTTSNTSTTTLATYSIPANTIGVNGLYKFTVFLTGTGSASRKQLQVNFGNGSATSTVGYLTADASASTGRIGGSISGIIRNRNSLSSQISSAIGTTDISDNSVNMPQSHIMATSTVNTGAISYISLGALVLNGADSAIVEGFMLEFIK